MLNVSQCISMCCSSVVPYIYSLQRLRTKGRSTSSSKNAALHAPKLRCIMVSDPGHQNTTQASRHCKPQKPSGQNSGATWRGCSDCQCFQKHHISNSTRYAEAKCREEMQECSHSWSFLITGNSRLLTRQETCSRQTVQRF